MLISSVSSRSRKKKKRRLFCAALVAGTVNKLKQSIIFRCLWLMTNLIQTKHGEAAVADVLFVDLLGLSTVGKL